MYFTELKSSREQTQILMDILPFLRPILKEYTEVNALGLEAGCGCSYIEFLHGKFYNEVNLIISKLHGLTLEEIEEEIDIFEKTELIFEIVNNEKLMHFLGVDIKR